MAMAMTRAEVRCGAQSIAAMEVGKDARDRRRLMDLIEEATVSPGKSLDLGLLQSIKALVRASDANVRTAFDVLFDKLKKNHSQVRMDIRLVNYSVLPAIFLCALWWSSRR